MGSINYRPESKAGRGASIMWCIAIALLLLVIVLSVTEKASWHEHEYMGDDKDSPWPDSMETFSLEEAWGNSIGNPANDEFIEEVAFNLGIDPGEVTQEQFNERYNK